MVKQENLSIGNRLKSTRETKELTLDQAANFTKIQRKTIEAMEEDRLSEEMDPAYAKIFLKKYASFLGLDSSELVEAYLSLHGPVPDRPIALETEAQGQARAVPAQKVAAIVGVALMGVVGIAFLAYLSFDLYATMAKNFRQGKKPVKAAVTKAALAPAKTMGVEKTPAGPKLLIPKSQTLKLTIQTRNDVWMQIKADGSVIFQNVLPKGSQESWTAQEYLELWTGNAAATQLFLNGRPLEGLGSGVKKGIRITRYGLQEAE